MRLAHKWIELVVVVSLTWAGTAAAQTFVSGSTGANGAFSPVANVTLAMPPDGVFNYTTVTIPAGVTVSFTRNAANTPVTILATGDVTINGTLNLNGLNSVGAGTNSTGPGAAGGPGGFNGGSGNIFGATQPMAGQGPGGGVPTPGAGGQGGHGTYGASASFVALIPMFGGSGGAGLNSFNITGSVGGGGGGGAILIASSGRITVGSTGAINANGGDAAFTNNNTGGTGSGGAIRLVAREITGAGRLSATGAGGGNGRIRLEALAPITYTGTISPAASITNLVGPVVAASTPALVNLPTLAITAVGGAAAPATPTASLATADVALPQGTANPVAVTISATNTPVGGSTAISVRLSPQTAMPTVVAVPTTDHTGTFTSSSATANVTFPLGQTSIIQAWASFTLTGQIASLFPLIDGEAVESVAMGSPLDDGKPVFNLVTKSGKEKRFDELALADQSKVLVAWQALAANR